MRIAIDAMGGDFGPRIVIPACIDALQRHPDLSLTIVGQQDEISSFLSDDHRRQYAERLDVLHAEKVVGNDEKPSHALRQRKDTSMHEALCLVAEGEAQACRQRR